MEQWCQPESVSPSVPPLAPPPPPAGRPAPPPPDMPRKKWVEPRRLGTLAHRAPPGEGEGGKREREREVTGEEQTSEHGKRNVNFTLTVCDEYECKH